MQQSDSNFGEGHPVNPSPLIEISQSDRDTYLQDGAVCLRNVIDPSFVSTLAETARDVIVQQREVGLLPTLPGRYLARRLPDFRQLIFQGPIGEAAGKILNSREIRFYFDEFFAKEPQSEAKTIWHSDRMGWPVSGHMVPSIWIPLTPIVKSNCLEVLAESQQHEVPYWLSTPNARKMVRPPDRPGYPDVEARRSNSKNRFLTWDMSVGDLLVVHPGALHYSGGNPTDDWRIALSIRVFGDDIRWQPRPDCLNLAGVSFDEMIEGERPMGSHFPLMWSNDGRRDTDRFYPTGFTTSWEDTERQEMNPYAIFEKAVEKGQVGTPNGHQP